MEFAKYWSVLFFKPDQMRNNCLRYAGTNTKDSYFKKAQHLCSFEGPQNAFC